MAYVLSEKERSAVSRLFPDERLEHFIKRVADWQMLWCIETQAEKNLEADLLLWPHPTYAASFARTASISRETQEIALEDFMSSWLPRLQAVNARLQVFPVSESIGVDISSEALRQLLEIALENYQ
jgi:hypothetical protein